MISDEIETYFTRADGSYVFARWGRPLAPIVFGVEEETLPVIKGAFEAMMVLANHQMAETDPEFGSNCMVFFFRDWAELLAVKGLDRLVPDLKPLVARLERDVANHYRIFRFDDYGGIKAAFVFMRMDQHLGAVPAETLALSQVVQIVVLWSDTAFRDRSPLTVLPGGATVLRPDIANLIRASYDPTMPLVSTDRSHALRLGARLEAPQ